MKLSFSKLWIVKPLHRKMIHCFEELQSDRGLWITNHLISIGTFGAGSRIIWFRSELQSGLVNNFPNWMIRNAHSEVPIWNDVCESLFKSELCSMDRESSNLDGNFGAGLWIFWFRSELWSGFVNLLIQIGTMEHEEWIFWFRSGLRCAYRKSLNVCERVKQIFKNLM